MVWVAIVVVQGTIVSLVDETSFMFAMHFRIFGYHRTFLKSLNTFLNFFLVFVFLIFFTF